MRPSAFAMWLRVYRHLDSRASRSYGADKCASQGSAMNSDPSRPSSGHSTRSIKLPILPRGPFPFLSSPTMTWGVYDYTSGSVIGQYPATGGNFTSVPYHRYLVALRVQDAFGIRKITLDGSGEFEAATRPDSQGLVWVAPNPLPASIPHQEFDAQGTEPQFQDLIVTMSPEIGARISWPRVQGAAGQGGL